MQTNAAEHIRQTLEDEIASGRLTPGSRLEELALADRFDVSRTPVREALRLLSTSGLIEIQRRKGAVVATMSMERLVGLFEVMSEFEGVCGRLAARRATEAEVQALWAQHEACGEAAKSKDANVYYEANATFHELIYVATHNPYLAEEVRQLRRRLQPYRRLQLRMRGRITESFHEHEAIVQAISDGDEEVATKALSSHVSVQGHRFADWLCSVNSLVSGRGSD
ncbi:MAG: GntR family transcriptional regulator [Filomicrobium sp.]